MSFDCDLESNQNLNYILDRGNTITGNLLYPPVEVSGKRMTITTPQDQPNITGMNIKLSTTQPLLTDECLSSPKIYIYRIENTQLDVSVNVRRITKSNTNSDVYLSIILFDRDHFISKSRNDCSDIQSSSTRSIHGRSLFQ